MIAGILVGKTLLNLEGDFEGLYLLRGNGAAWFELTDDIFLGNYERVLLKVEFAPLLSRILPAPLVPGNQPYLHHAWHDRTGHGYVQSTSPDGTRFLVSFGRFIDSEGKAPRGLFIGGGLPYYRYEHNNVTMNETGMALFDGRRWNHIWCNANEGIASAATPADMIFPSSWRFVDSNVLFSHDGELVLHSGHSVIIDGAPLTIDRFAFIRAGERQVVLAIKITNTGVTPAGYFYVYGDEPWVGDYGSSAGNVGWTEAGLQYYEGVFDTAQNTVAGMYDVGNKMIPGETGPFTGLANFISWRGGMRPDLGYFSNKEGKFAELPEKVPLYSRTNRVMFLQWGPRPIKPGQSDLILLTIGLADKNPKTGLPKAPPSSLDLDDLQFVLQNH